MQEFKMEEDDIVSMYDTDDIEPTKPTNNMIKKGEFVSEIKIGDQTLTVVNPAYVEYVNLQLAELKRQCAFLENELRNARQSNKQTQTHFNKAINQINSRFGF